MENEKLKAIATEIISSQTLPKDKFGSVILILMVVSIILTAMRFIQECNKNQKKTNIKFYKNKIRQMCIKPSWFTKMRLRQILRRELKPVDYKIYSSSLCQSIFNKGAKITDEEVATLLEVIND